MKPICPCRTCPEKGCGDKHETCEPYKEWAEEWRRQKKDVKSHQMIYTEGIGRPKTKRGGKWMNERDRTKFE